MSLDYDTMPYADLQALCKERELSAGGKAEELVARLREADLLAADKLLDLDDDLAGEGSPAASEATAPAEGADVPPETPEADGDQGKAIDGPVEDVADPDATRPKLKTFEATYSVPGGGLADGLHQMYLAQVAQEAAAAGHSVKGGARLVEIKGDKALYEVLLRRS